MMRSSLTSKVVLLLALAAFLLVGPAVNAAFVPANMTATKTVGLLPPPACGSNSSITVPPGTTVYFCYTLVNNSGANFSYNLFDNVLGTVATNATSSYGTTDRQFKSWSAYTNSTGVPVVNQASWQVAGSAIQFSAAAATVSLQDQLNSVPALAPAGLLALGGVLLAAGLVFLRRIG